MMRPHEYSTNEARCAATSKTREGWRVLTCCLGEGHDEPHVDPELLRQDKTATGFWWSA
jgi:hypothetical protein